MNSRKLILVALLLCLVLVPLTERVPGQAVAQDDPVLVRGAPVSGGSNGLAIDSAGNLVITNVWGGTITTMDVTTGQILQVFGPEFGLMFPDDVAVGPDQAIYVTLTGPAGQIVRISTDGERSTLAQIPWVNPLGFSDDGRLFAAGCLGPSNGIYEVDLNDEVEPRLIVGDLPGCAVNAFDFGPDGFLYGPNVFTGEILKVDVETGEITTALEGFVFPDAVEFDSQGRAYVADGATGEIYRVDLQTGNREVLVSLEFGLDNLVFDAEDHLFVSSSVDGSITEVLADGTSRVISAGGMVAPAGIAVHEDSLFVAEPQAIREFDRTTGEQISIELSLFAVSEVGQPITLAVDGTDLITSSWFDNAVRIFNWETRELIAAFVDFAGPVNALRFQNDLIVVELETANVIRARGDDPAQRETLATLVVPAGLAATEDDLWVSDWATGMVWQLVADGEALAEPKAVGQDFVFPEGLAVTPDGLLIIVETGTQRLLALDPGTGELSVIAEQLAIEPPPPEGVPLPPTMWFNGVAVAEDGTIYAGGRADNVIYRWSPTP